MIGIYKLVFNNQYAYIGQSINLERRKKQHIYGMSSGKHHNKNILNLFERFGTPEFIVLEQCDIEKLNEREFHYVDAETLVVVNLAPIDGLSDPDSIPHHNKKYSKEAILLVAEMLSDRNMPFKDIESITGVKASTIAAISMGEAHGWLESSVPDVYHKILTLKNQRQKAIPKKYTEEQIFEILVYLGMSKLPHREIAEITDIPQTVIQSIAGGYSYTELKTIYPKEYNDMLIASKLRKHKEQLTVVSPAGQHYLVLNRTEFARNNNLRKASFLDLCNGKTKSYKDWTILND